jgi:DNA-binding LacI/PurR family transcriptional regulator
MLHTIAPMTSLATSKSSTSNLARHKAIAQDLHAQIATGKLQPGALLPSYRTLMHQYDVTVGTVRQALGTLQAQGLVRSLPGIGCVVSQNPVKSPSRRVGIVVVGTSSSPGFVEQLSLMHDELDRLRCDVGIRFMPTVDEASTLALAAWAGRHDGVLLYGRVPVKLAQAMESTHVPCVLLGEPFDGPCPVGVGNVTLDLDATAALAIGILAGLGHTHIALCSRAGSRYFDLLSQAFQSSLARHKLPAGPFWHFEGKRETDYVNAVAWLKTLNPRPTALLVEEGSRATALLNALINANLPVPAQFTLLAIVPSEKNFAGAEIGVVSENLPQLSRILTPTHDLVLRGASMLAQGLQSGSHVVRVEKIVGSYLPGQTCRYFSSSHERFT